MPKTKICRCMDGHPGHSMECQSPSLHGPDGQLAEMTTTELLALIETARLTSAQYRAVRAEIKSREI